MSNSARNERVCILLISLVIWFINKSYLIKTSVAQISFCLLKSCPTVRDFTLRVTIETLSEARVSIFFVSSKRVVRNRGVQRNVSVVLWV